MKKQYGVFIIPPKQSDFGAIVGMSQAGIKRVRLINTTVEGVDVSEDLPYFDTEALAEDWILDRKEDVTFTVLPVYTNS